MVRRTLCWLGFHSAPEGMGATLAIYWSCSRCGQMVAGELTMRRRR
jgi:hypothetical protein